MNLRNVSMPIASAIIAGVIATVLWWLLGDTFAQAVFYGLIVAAVSGGYTWWQQSRNKTRSEP